MIENDYGMLMYCVCEWKFMVVHPMERDTHGVIRLEIYNWREKGGCRGGRGK